VKGLVAGFAMLVAAPATAHDFWLQPQAFQPAPGAVTSLTLQVGDGPDRQRSALPLRRITRFDAIGPDGQARDLRDGLTLGAPEADAQVRLATPGVYVLAFETDSAAHSHLPADRFEAYLRDEGLTPALEDRARRRRAGRQGSERYGRRAKALVQVGLAGADAQVATRPVGLSLEIVPRVSPYVLPRPGGLPVQVLYEGRPLAGALVKLTDLAHDAAPREAHRTDASGEAAFAMPTAGAWRLAVVWTRPLGEGEDADYETTFSSLVFGLPPNAP